MIDQLNIAIRFALYANLMLLFGLPSFGLFALKGAERVHLLSLRPLTCWLAALGIALSLVAIVAMTASMAGVALLAVDISSISMMIFETSIGNAWLVRILALLATLAIAFQMDKTDSRSKLSVVVLSSGLALASLAWTGHGAAGEGLAGTSQLIADIVHLLAAGAWLGALAALTGLLFRDLEALGEDYMRLAHRLLKGFSVAGSIIVALVILSGLVNSWMLVGPQHVLTLHTTLYGQLLIAKVLLFGIMLMLATVNRSILTPAFERALTSGETSRATKTLRSSIALELGVALIVLGLVAWLGTLEPPASM